MVSSQDDKPDSKKADDVPPASGEGSLLPVIVIAVIAVAVIVLALVLDGR